MALQIGGRITIGGGVTVAGGYYSSSAVLITSTSSPYIQAYAWDSATGFGSKYANPNTLATAQGYGAAFSPQNDAVLMSYNGGALSFQWSLGSGFGAKYTQASPTSGANTITFNPAGDAVAYPVVANQGCVAVYPWNSATGFGTQYTNPGTIPSQNGQDVAFSPDGSVIMVAATTTSPYVYAYQWSSATGFGTKYANPSSALNGNASSISFTPAGDAVVIGVNSVSASPYIHAYAWDNTTGFGTKYANPSTAINDVVWQCKFNPQGDALAVATSSASTANVKYMAVYAWSAASGFGSKYADPATMPINVCDCVAWSANGDTVAFGSRSTPFILAYPWNSATGFGTKYANPSVLPGSGAQGAIAFSPN